MILSIDFVLISNEKDREKLKEIEKIFDEETYTCRSKLIEKLKQYENTKINTY